MLAGLRFRWLVAAILLACVAVVVACSGSGSSTGIPPITGIVIRAETLTTGRGCGRGPAQLFKYAAIVYGYKGSDDKNDLANYDVPVTAGVYDCFADGTFVELPETGGESTFRIEIFAYSEPAYTASSAAIESAGTNGVILRTTNPTWSTVCSATQLRDVQALAVCEPLISGLAPSPIVLRTGAFSRSDGTVSACIRTLGGDAGADGGNDDAGDAASDASTDAATTDASTEGGTDGGTTAPSGLVFSTVRIVTTSNGAGPVPETTISCPDAFVIPNATAGATYDLDVTLLDEAAALVGKTKCSAKAAAGVETAATCTPVQ